ncbi:MAG: sugar phosphate isomerase/epimerase [Bryobacteraceae bacterium]
MVTTTLALQEKQPMTTLSRRGALLASLSMAGTPVPLQAVQNRMSLALHQTTSAAAGFRGSLEGWSRAGIRFVELSNVLLDDFLKAEDLAVVGRILTDLGLTAVQAATGVTGLWEPNPNRAVSIAKLKARCEAYATLGLKNVYATTLTTQKIQPDDYRAGADNMHEAGEIAREFNLSLRIEFVRTSTFISTLPTLLKTIRAAGHPNVVPMFDCYHFWSGLSKMEDMDLIRPAEIGHVHFQDVPDIPRELLDVSTRAIPGDGVSPLIEILHKLAIKDYTGPLSVELFLPRFQQGDPFEIAREVRRKAETVMRRAGVM